MVRHQTMRDPPSSSRFESVAPVVDAARVPLRASIRGFPIRAWLLPARCARPPYAQALTIAPSLSTSQVNIPKAKKSFCKKCKKHAPHKVTQYKTGKASLYAQGASPPTATSAPRTAASRHLRRRTTDASAKDRARAATRAACTRTRCRPRTADRGAPAPRRSAPSAAARLRQKATASRAARRGPAAGRRRALALAWRRGRSGASSACAARAAAAAIVDGASVASTTRAAKTARGNLPPRQVQYQGTIP